MRQLVTGFLAGVAAIAVGTTIAYLLSLGVVALIAKVNDINEASLFVLAMPCIPAAAVWLWLGKVRRDMVNLPPWLSALEMAAAACLLALAAAAALYWMP
jgi:uncharacterized membrane protein